MFRDRREILLVIERGDQPMSCGTPTVHATTRETAGRLAAFLRPRTAEMPRRCILEISVVLESAELSLPDGYRVPRHFHPMGERVEVRQGTLLVGTGERFDVRNAETLRAGDTAYTPAGVHHYWVARGPTVVALTFDGPYTLTYVNAYEAPKGTSFPRQY
jgi:hypothetical protein